MISAFFNYKFLSLSIFVIPRCNYTEQKRNFKLFGYKHAQLNTFIFFVKKRMCVYMKAIRPKRQSHANISKLNRHKRITLIKRVRA